MSNSIFRKESLDRVNSPEELNDYIKTSSPGAWLIIGAAIVLLVSVLVWGIFGSLDTTVKVNGIANGGAVTCYTSDVSDIKEGDKVTVGEHTGTVLSVSKVPLSLADLTEQLDVDDYTLYCLALSEWNYVIEISLPEHGEDGFVRADIVTDSINPISFIFD